jgi:peptidoglycan/LPS O-acetylase OafA/YrhL
LVESSHGETGIDEVAPEPLTAPTDRTPPPTRRQVRLDSLTGLRWFAALAVFGFHLTTAPAIGSDHAVRTFLRPLFASGTAGVTFFFVLSGFVLCWSSRPADTPLSFFRRRVARVFPNHIVTWFAVIAVFTAIGRPTKIGPALAGGLLLQSWVPSQNYYFAGNTPAWSLSCEMAFYAAFPLLIVLFRRLTPTQLRLTAVFLPLLTIAVPVISFAMRSDRAYWFVWVFPATRLLDFALGIAVARLMMANHWRGPRLLVATAVVLAFYATEQLVPDRWEWVAWMQVPFALLIAAAAQADVRGEASILRSRPLVWLGGVSFAFYLVHQPVVRLMDQVSAKFPRPYIAAVCIVAAALLSVGFAAMLHKLVETPAERALSGRPRRRPAPAPTSQEMATHTLQESAVRTGRVEAPGIEVGD